MLRRFGHITLSLWLSFLLLFGGAAKEAVHLFTGHTDTVHHTHRPGELQWEPKHHHCDFLSFVLTPYDYVPFYFCPRPAAPVFGALAQALPVLLTSRVVAHDCLRGPPAPRRSLGLFA